MRKLTLIVAVTTLTAASAMAQQGLEFKPRFAAPAYGVAIMPLQISHGNDPDNAFTFLLPAADVRVSLGDNVGRRGGFWTGLEAGIMAFFQPTAVGFDVPFVDKVGFSDSYSGGGGAYNPSYDVETSIDIQYAFLLAKYGYRIDIGPKLIGIGAGAEVGIGARVVDGHLRMSTGSQASLDNAYGFVEWLPTHSFGIMVDAAVEGTLRLGPNFRFFVRPGFATTFLGLTKPDDSAYQNAKDDLRNAEGVAGAWSQGEVDLLLLGYDVGFERIIFTARAGFSVSY